MMVNKCSVTGCKSLYVKENVKLHRFPLGNADTLPLWIAATKRDPEWKPCKSSRLCGNHFKASEYIVGHSKGVLKPSAIPTIDYCVEIPRYNKKKYGNFKVYDKMKHVNKVIKTEPTSQENQTPVERVNIDYNNIFNRKITESNDNSEKNKYQDEVSSMKESDTLTFSDYDDDDDDDDDDEYSDNDNSGSEILKNNLDDSNTEVKTEDPNNEQCYYKEGMETLTLAAEVKRLEDQTSTTVYQSVADKSFNKVMSLRMKRNKRRTKDIYKMYFRQLEKKNAREIAKQVFYDDVTKFSRHIEDQLKVLQPHERLYFSTKRAIDKILAKAQVKMSQKKIQEC